MQCVSIHWKNGPVADADHLKIRNRTTGEHQGDAKWQTSKSA